MDFVFVMCSLLFVVQIITNIVVLVKVIPQLKRLPKPKINLSDIMSLTSQLSGDKNEPV